MKNPFIARLLVCDLALLCLWGKLLSQTNEEIKIKGSFDDIPRFRTISEPEITNLHTIDTRRGLQQFGTHRVIVFRVNAEYAALYESSGTSPVSLSQPPPNVENGLGIFSGISGDTLFFEVIKQ
ncbi:MAG: hypothetical protein AAF587_08705 [Bacteroidota bacterium]